MLKSLNYHGFMNLYRSLIFFLFLDDLRCKLLKYKVLCKKTSSK